MRKVRSDSNLVWPWKKGQGERPGVFGKGRSLILGLIWALVLPFFAGCEGFLDFDKVYRPNNYVDCITKYNCNWEFLEEQLYKTGSEFDATGTRWIFGDGNVIDGKLYIALRTRDYSASAVGIWTLDLQFLEIHPVINGVAEAVEKHEGRFWVIQRDYFVSEYTLEWEYVRSYWLERHYDGGVWIEDSLYCNSGGCVLDVYDFNGDQFIKVKEIKSLGNEGFEYDRVSDMWWFAGKEDHVVWEGVLIGDEIIVLNSYDLGFNRVNQGVAKDEEGNFYTFSHDVCFE